MINGGRGVYLGVGLISGLWQDVDSGCWLLITYIADLLLKTRILMWCELKARYTLLELQAEAFWAEFADTNKGLCS